MNKHILRITAAALCVFGGAFLYEPSVSAEALPVAEEAVVKQMAPSLFFVREAKRTSVQEGSDVLLYTEQSLLRLDEASAKAWPQYEAALSYYGRRVLMEGERAKQVLDSELDRRDYESEKKRGEKAEGDAPDSNTGEERPLSLCDIREFFLRRANASVMSVLVTHEYNYGGEHGNYTMQGITHRADGQPVLWREVFADADALPELLEKKLRAKYPAVSFFDLHGALNDMARRDSFVWTMDADGITFYFAPYVLASRADGMLTAFISWSSAPELFRQEWAQMEEAYAVELPVGRLLPTDLNGDGNEEALLVTGGKGELFAVSYEGITTEYSEEVTEVLATRLHTRDGRNYVYADGLRQDGRRGIFVWELTSEGPAFKGVSNLTLEMKEALGTRRTWQVLRNPEDFLLWDDRTASLVHCTVNEAGMPVIQ